MFIFPASSSVLAVLYSNTYPAISFTATYVRSFTISIPNPAVNRKLVLAMMAYRAGGVLGLAWAPTLTVDGSAATEINTYWKSGVEWAGLFMIDKPLGTSAIVEITGTSQPYTHHAVSVWEVINGGTAEYSAFNTLGPTLQASWSVNPAVSSGGAGFFVGLASSASSLTFSCTFSFIPEATMVYSAMWYSGYQMRIGYFPSITANTQQLNTNESTATVDILISHITAT